MTRPEDPWWSSATDDPAHGGPAPGDPAHEDGVAGDGASGQSASDHDPDICGVCPICVGARLLQEGRPELYAHLSEATHHLAAALRTLLDVAADARPSAPPTDERVTRIDLD